MTVVACGWAAWLLHGLRQVTRCDYAGPPRNVLTVTISGTNAGGEIRRAGAQIVVAKDGRAQDCSGTTPTVHNTDAIRVRLEDSSSLQLQLAGGELAPGATAERDGRSEIEIAVSGKQGVVEVAGAPADESWQWVPGPRRGQPGLNLDAGQSGDRDVDLTIAGEGTFIDPDAEGGDDRIDVGAGAGFVGHEVSTIDGGPATTCCGCPTAPAARSTVGKATTGSPAGGAATRSTARTATTSSTCATTQVTRSTAGLASIAFARTGATFCAAARSSAGADAGRRQGMRAAIRHGSTHVGFSRGG